MVVDKTTISAPVSVSHGGALDALAQARPRENKSARKGWLGLGGVEHLLSKISHGDADNDDNSETIRGHRSPKSRKGRDPISPAAISLPLERPDVAKGLRQIMPAERKESRWWQRDGANADPPKSRSKPGKSGDSIFAKLMKEETGKTSRGLRAFGMQTHMDLLALDAEWQREMESAIPLVSVSQDNRKEQLATSLDFLSKSTPGLATSTGKESLGGVIDAGSTGAAGMPTERSRGKDAEPIVVKPIFSAGTDSAKDGKPQETGNNRDAGAGPTSTPVEKTSEISKDSSISGRRSSHSISTSTRPRFSTLKQIEADYRYSIMSRRQARLEADERRERERREEALARLQKSREPTIWQAAYTGDLHRVQEMIEKRLAGPNEWDVNNGDATPLHLACAGNQMEVARYLISKGADPNFRAGTLKATPFHWAAKFGNVEMVHLLYTAGGDPTILDGAGFDCLQLALSSGNQACVTFLVAVMGDLFQAAHYGILERIVYLIENKFYDVDETGDLTGKGITALHLVALNGHFKCAEYLLSKGANPNAETGETGATPLIWAVRARNLEMTRLLVSHGADAKHRDRNGFNALNFAQVLRPPFPELVAFFVKECGMDSADAVPPALVAGADSEDDDEDVARYDKMDEIEMRAERELKNQLKGMSAAQVEAFFAAALKAAQMPKQRQMVGSTSSMDLVSSASSSRGELDFDPYDASERIDPICLATIKVRYEPLHPDELPLLEQGGIVRVLRNFDDFWSLGEIDEAVEDGGDGLNRTMRRVRRRRGYFPSAYVEEQSWGRVAAGMLGRA